MVDDISDAFALYILMNMIGGAISCFGTVCCGCVGVCINDNCKPSHMKMQKHARNPTMYERITFQGSKTNPVVHSGSLRKWEEFIHDGRDINLIAQLLECNKNEKIPIDAIDYIIHMCHDNKKALSIEKALKENKYDEALSLYDDHITDLVKRLFEKHAMVYDIRVHDAVNKWLPRFENVFDEKDLQVLYKLRDDSEWDWM